ncbi:hypothetical protein K7X08_011397 [Anisodus acutangulus]|uniref:Uncharacterized protein n=1 Tax=Anisodus acutangulus TaxID=402998 RepID=A0A9Q1MMP1_9SOLA|nr:hypothetical protein K7X08_011397 [Anisodus acutangulus]
METSLVSEPISVNISSNTPIRTNPPLNTPMQPGQSSSSNLPEDLSRALVFKGFDEPLDISYYGDDTTLLMLMKPLTLHPWGERREEGEGTSGEVVAAEEAVDAAMQREEAVDAAMQREEAVGRKVLLKRLKMKAEVEAARLREKQAEAVMHK